MNSGFSDLSPEAKLHARKLEADMDAKRREELKENITILIKQGIGAFPPSEIAERILQEIEK